MITILDDSRRWPTHHPNSMTTVSLYLLYSATSINAVHHMKRAPLAYVLQRDETVPLVVQNLCSDTIYPGIVTQSGTAPSVGGFKLQTGETRNLTVGADWQGRVWGRTNCSFNSDGTGPSNNGGNNGGGRACGSGDCGGIVNCKATVSNLASLLGMDTDNSRARHQ